MVGGMFGGSIHYRVNWKWRVILNLCAYSVKDPSSLTQFQKYTRLYRSCLRRLHLLNCARLRMYMNYHKNYFDQVQEFRADFQKARKLEGKDLENFMKEKEEWLELTYFPAVSHWPNRRFSNKINLNVGYPDEFHSLDSGGYYKPRPLLASLPSSGPYYAEYPLGPNYFAMEKNTSLLNRSSADERRELEEEALKEIKKQGQGLDK